MSLGSHLMHLGSSFNVVEQLIECVLGSWFNIFGQFV